jgi:hypothetical protein
MSKKNTQGDILPQSLIFLTDLSDNSIIVRNVKGFFGKGKNRPPDLSLSDWMGRQSVPVLQQKKRMSPQFSL